MVQEFWRSDRGLHINIKELRAAMSAVQSLALPGETVHLAVDNQVAYSYLKKGGGKLHPFNEMLRPFLRWCWEKDLNVKPNWVKSEDMLADGISRWDYDTGDYTLSKELFLEIQSIFSQSNFRAQVDMFASPGNAKFPLFCSRWPHHQALAVNALETPLGGHHFRQVYANPPWNLISAWLQRLKDHPETICLTVVPYWVGSVWWPLLMHLHKKGTPVVLAAPRPGMFTNCLQEKMPATRWPLLCLLLSGKSYNERRFRLKISHYI
jgi:hypothetical protein